MAIGLREPTLIKQIEQLASETTQSVETLPVLIAPVNPAPRRDLRWLGGKLTDED